MRTIPLNRLAKGDMVCRVGTKDISPPAEVLQVTPTFPATAGQVEVGIQLDDDRGIFTSGSDTITADILDPSEMFPTRRRKFLI